MVGPGVGAPAGEGSEALEVAGVEELAQTALSGPRRFRVGPPELKQLGSGEELVLPDVADDREVARLHDARRDRLAAIMLDDGAVVAVCVEITLCKHALCLPVVPRVDR